MLPEKTVNTHYNEPQMDRRLKLYREGNAAESGNTVQDFFAKTIPTTNGGKPASENIRVSNSFLESDYELLHDMQAFIERNGKPCCLNLITERDNAFLKNLEKQAQKTEEHHNGAGEHKEHEGEEDELAAIIREEEEETRKRVEWQKFKAAQDAEDAEKKKANEIQEMAKQELIKQQERDLLDTRSQPIRQYLMDNLVPHLTQGLIDLCKKVPADPVDALADFLIAKAD